MLQQVNRELLPMKGHYFLFNAATGPLVTFLPTIAKQLGFSGFITGTMYMVLPISGLVAKPLFGFLADKFKKHKTFFITFQAILAIAFLAINFIPSIETGAVTTLSCNGDAFLDVHSSDGTFSSKISEAVKSSSTVDHKCDLTCEGNNRSYIELCENWHAVQFCSLRNTNASTPFTFTADVTMDKTTQVKDVIYIRLINATFSDGVTRHPACLAQMRTTCETTCPRSAILTSVLAAANNTRSTSQTSTYQFHLFLHAAIISWIGMAVVVNIADAVCISLLGMYNKGLMGEDKKKDYGKQKLWGSVGFGIFGLGSGYLIDLISQGKSEKDYSVLFYMMLFAIALDMLVSFTLKTKLIQSAERPPSVMWELLSVAKEGRVLVFGWWCIGSGMCTAVVWNFLFWYTEVLATDAQFTWIKTLQGLITATQCFGGELPFNFISGTVLRKLGHVNVMSLVLLVYATRFMAYSMVRNPWIFLPLELLHGPSFGLCWPAMVSYGDKIAPSGTQATMQGLVGGVFEGIGVAGGSLLCGWLIDAYGSVATFRVFSVGALVWLTVHWLLQLLLREAKAGPLYQGHNHLATYAPPNDAIRMTISQELQTY